MLYHGCRESGEFTLLLQKLLDLLHDWASGVNPTLRRWVVHRKDRLSEYDVTGVVHHELQCALDVCSAGITESVDLVRCLKALECDWSPAFGIGIIHCFYTRHFRDQASDFGWIRELRHTGRATHAVDCIAPDHRDSRENHDECRFILHHSCISRLLAAMLRLGGGGCKRGGKVGGGAR